MRTSKEDKRVIRERGCKECGHRFTTREKCAVLAWVDC